MKNNNLSTGFAQVVDVMPTPDGWWVSLWDIEAKKRISGEFNEAVEFGELVEYSADTMVKSIKVVQKCDFPKHLLGELPIFRGSYDDFLTAVKDSPKPQ